MNKRKGVVLLVIVAVIAVIPAVMHMSCLYFGPACYSYQMAPKVIVESAKAGTLLAPIGAFVVSALFLLMAAYALSAAQLIRKLPLLSLGIYFMSAACVIRGILGIQLWFRFPERLNEFGTVSNWLWLLAGILFFVGYRLVKSDDKSRRSG